MMLKYEFDSCCGCPYNPSALVRETAQMRDMLNCIILRFVHAFMKNNQETR